MSKVHKVMSLQLIYALYEKDQQCCHEEGLIEGQAKKNNITKGFFKFT